MASKICFNKAKALVDELFELSQKGVSLENDPNGMYKGKLRELETVKQNLSRRQLKLLD